MGDVLVAANGRAIAEPDALADLLERTPAGETVTFRVLRAGVEKDVSVRLGERPAGKRQRQG